MNTSTKISKKMPGLRFRGFSDEWENKRFDEVFKIGAGGDVSSKHMKKTQDSIFKYPIYANSEKNNGLYGYSDIFKESTNCITVTGRGSLGIAVARHESFYPIVRLLTLRLKQDGDIDFFENLINRVNFFVESTGVPQLTGPQISSYRITIPASGEQEKIARFLTTVDDKISTLQDKSELLKKYKKGAMQAIFSPKIRFKDRNGKQYRDWQETKLKELATITTGRKDVNAGNPKGGYPFYTCAKDHTYSDYYSFDGEAILIAGNAEVGLCQYYDGKFEAYQRTYVLQDFKIQGTYLFRYLSHFFRQYALGLKQTGAMSFIKIGMLNNFDVPVPSEEEQQKISDFLTSLDAKINLTEKELKQAKQFKKALLQQMFV